MTLSTSRRNILAIIAVLALSAGLAMLGADSASANGNGRVIAVTGVASVDNEQVLVHIIAVVNAGRSDQEVAEAALRGVNARGLTASDYTLLANSWDQFSDGNAGNDYVVQRYNAIGEPSGARAAIDLSRATWNGADSPFAFQVPMGTTNICPSLVNECKGRQAFDGNNDIAWMKLRDANTLGVTWSGTSTDEADVAFNTNFTWSNDDPASAIDIETVALHELGHVAGIGHSDVIGSIMEPVYAGIRRTLTADDIAALQAWYGSTGGATATPEPTPDTTPTATPTPEPSPTALYVGTSSAGDGVAYSTSGRNGRDLIIEVTITDGSAANTVEGASVSIAVDDESGSYGTGSGTTDANGTVRWRIKNGASGTWFTTVTSATLSGLSCGDCGEVFGYPG